MSRPEFLDNLRFKIEALCEGTGFKFGIYQIEKVRKNPGEDIKKGQTKYELRSSQSGNQLRTGVPKYLIGFIKGAIWRKKHPKAEKIRGIKYSPHFYVVKCDSLDIEKGTDVQVKGFLDGIVWQDSRLSKEKINGSTH